MTFIYRDERAGHLLSENPITPREAWGKVIDAIGPADYPEGFPLSQVEAVVITMTDGSRRSLRRVPEQPRHL